MLSRSAQGLYWMGRYLERAEHLCRLLRLADGSLVDRPCPGDILRLEAHLRKHEPAAPWVRSSSTATNIPWQTPTPSRTTSRSSAQTPIPCGAASRWAAKTHGRCVTASAPKCEPASTWHTCGYRSRTFRGSGGSPPRASIRRDRGRDRHLCGRGGGDHVPRRGLGCSCSLGA